MKEWTLSLKLWSFEALEYVMKRRAEQVDHHLGGGLVHRRSPHGSGVTAVAQLSQGKASEVLQQEDMNEWRLDFKQKYINK